MHTIRFKGKFEEMKRREFNGVPGILCRRSIGVTTLDLIQ